MNLYLVEMVDSMHPITQKVEIWADNAPSPEQLSAKVQELAQRFIRSDRRSVMLEQQPDVAQGFYYSPVGDSSESPSELAFVAVSCTEYPNGFTLRDRNATIERM